MIEHWTVGMLNVTRQDDPLITPRATERYYKEATEVTPDIHDYYRLFMVPGLGHCSGGASSRPSELFAQLRAWVENGTAPESTPVQVESTDGTIHGRILCPYPSKARLDACEDPANAKCWSCSPRTGEKG